MSAKLGESFSVTQLADDGHVGRDAQEPGHQPAQVDRLAVRLAGVVLTATRSCVRRLHEIGSMVPATDGVECDC